ncbi:MAG: hypothetical protein Q9174_005671, partial [Haloplaca sp. 1 TL-2023]
VSSVIGDGTPKRAALLLDARPLNHWWPRAPDPASGRQQRHGGFVRNDISG